MNPATLFSAEEESSRPAPDFPSKQQNIDETPVVARSSRERAYQNPVVSIVGEVKQRKKSNQSRYTKG